MANRARVEGLERLKAKVARLPAAAKKKMSEKNHDAARRQVNGARIRIDRGDAERGHIEDTLRVEKGQTETGWYARVGGPAQPYPLSLETGHRAADGSHVPANPAWFPAKNETLAKHKRGMGQLLKETVSEIVR